LLLAVAGQRSAGAHSLQDDTKCDISGNVVTVASQVEWCSRDHGFNEGATCGANALAEAGISGVPEVVAGVVLGNTWDRTNMIGAAKAAYKSGKRKEAIDAVICCQIHNPPAQNCLKGNRTAIENWLKEKTK
jgi:hypothetical protein